MSPPAEDSSPVTASRPSQAIIEAIAEQEGVDVTDVEPPTYDPLYTVVNPEALDSLFARNTTTGRVVLVYEGYEVVVESSGDVTVTQSAEGDTAKAIEE